MSGVIVFLLTAVGIGSLIAWSWCRLDETTRPGVWDAETDERTQLAPEDEERTD